MSAHATAVEAHGETGHVTVKTLLIIYGVLIGLMFLTVGAAMIDMGRANFIVAMTIALVKMILIILYFMHVRYSSKLTWLASVGAFLFFLVLVVGLLNDYWTRMDLNVPGK
jgi:cytochrome c oxidase subunit IV